MNFQTFGKMANSNDFLFNLNELPTSDAVQKFKQIETPLWTKNKALFIARYLQTFTYVTKHGTYIDGFAGPQHLNSKEESWSAKLVMSNRPPWLRNFHLFDQDAEKTFLLEELKAEYLSEHGDKPVRSVNVYSGDTNILLPKLLRDNPIREKEATFCLLDQRSTECSWDTVEAVAQHKGKEGGHRIEIFYFLAQGWMDRTIKSWTINTDERKAKWWGGPGVDEFLNLPSHERGIAMAKRFKEEFGYKYAYPFPIQKEGANGRIMFWMIHASDHPRAPVLMRQAYGHIGAGGGLNDPHPEFDFEYPS